MRWKEEREIQKKERDKVIDVMKNKDKNNMKKARYVWKRK